MTSCCAYCYAAEVVRAADQIEMAKMSGGQAAQSSGVSCLGGQLPLLATRIADHANGDDHAGGLTMVLTPSEYGGVGGMPRNAIDYDGPIDLTGSITQIADTIVRVVLSEETSVAGGGHR